MGYAQSLEAAGAKILAFQNFGSYQGDWWARVEYNGTTGWVNGSYGSCEGCDSFKSEFGWDEPTQEALAKFGKKYLDSILTQEEAETKAKENSDWDMEAEEMIDFIQIQGGTKKQDTSRTQ